MTYSQQPAALPVVHSLPTWLPLTATWLYHQVRYLPDDIINHVACRTTEHVSQFSIPNLHCLGQSSRRSIPNRLLTKFGVLKPVDGLYLSYLSKVIEQVGARLLHSHWGDVGWTNLTVARRAHLGHVVTFYGKDVNFYPRQCAWQKRYRELFRQVDLVLCEGRHMAQCIVNLGCNSDKVRVHHLGVEVDKIAFRPRTWSSGPLRVLLAGSFREKKGFPDALEALGLLQRDVPALEITIIGDASQDMRSHPEKARILETLEKHQLATKTRLLGYQPYAVLFEEAYRHHIFISPSLTAKDGDTEGGAPVTLIEMAATGIPIVSTSHCDIPSVILDGRTGLLASERDVPGLLSHLRWLVGHPDSWQGLLVAGRKHVETHYDAAKQGVRLRDIYRSLHSQLGVV